MSQQYAPQKQYQMTATVQSVSPTEAIPSKTGGMPFQKRQLVVNDELGNPIMFELNGKSTSIGDNLTQGMNVNITYNIKSNFWQGGNKWFTALTAFQVAPNQIETPQAQVAQNGAQFAHQGLPAQQMAQPAQQMAQPAQHCRRFP